VLDETPEPFAAATREKRGALEHFQPEGVLISRGAERMDRPASTRRCSTPHGRSTHSPEA
jgi:hypothetical protein